MRWTLPRTTALGAAACFIVTALVAASPAGADDATPAPLVKSMGEQLPVADLRGIELDEPRGRLYVAQNGGAAHPLVVTDLDGNLVDEVDHVTHVSDVALSPDGSTLLATQGFTQVTALDPDSFASTDVYPAPDAPARSSRR